MGKQEQRDREIVSAVYDGDVNALKELVAKGVNPNTKGYDGQPLLLRAASSNKVEVVKYLVNDLHFPIEVCCKLGCTALLTAASCGALDVVQYLVSAGANIMARTALDETALHLSARTESVETFKFLQQSGIPMEFMDIRERNVLHHAAEFAYPKMVEHILQEGYLPVDCKDKNGQTPLMLTADFPRNRKDCLRRRNWVSSADDGVNKVIKLLLDAGADPSIKDVLGRTALHRTLGNLANFHFLWKKCRDFTHAVDEKGQTPIHRALSAFRNRWAMNFVMRLLLQAGADVKSCDIEGRTALYIAVEQHCCDEVQALIKAGAETSCFEKDILTKILHISVKKNDFLLTNRMLEEGADVNGRRCWNRDPPSTDKDHTVRCLGCYDSGGQVYFNLSGQSPLFEALSSVKMTNLLIDAGANVNFKDDHGCTPLQRALDDMHYEVLGVLLSAGADPKAVDDCGVSLLHVRSTRPDQTKMITKFMGRLLQAGASLNVADHKGRTPLHYAAKSRNHMMLKLLVDSGADVNLKDDHGCSPLQSAIYNDNFEVIRVLLDAGADPNSMDEYGVSLLHILSARPVGSKGIPKSTKRLLQAGASVNVADHKGRTPLHYAAKAQNFELIKILLSAGADVNSMDVTGETPLLMLPKVFECYFIQAVHIMLDAGANLTASDKNGQKLIHQTSQVGDFKALDYLVGIWPPTLGRDNYGNNILHYATKSGKNRLICIEHILIRKLVPVDERNMQGQTALGMVVEHGRKWKSVWCEVDRLLAEGASPTAKDNNGNTPLHTASIVGDVKVMKVLLNAGADVTSKDDSGQTPLHLAAKAHNVEGLELLLHKGASIDDQDNDGQTPLMLAVGSSEAANLLLRKGASISIKDYSGKIALLEAIDHGSHAAVKLLWATVSNLMDIPQKYQIKAVHLAVKAGDEEMLNYLISLGISVSDCWWDPEHKTTLLHCATQSGVEILKKLIDSGLTESAHDHEGHTPLHLAVMSLNFIGTKYLLEEAHVPVNDRDADGRTAIMLAVSDTWCYADVFAMLEILVHAGADIRAQDKGGKTVYQLAYRPWADKTHDVLDYMQHRL